MVTIQLPWVIPLSVQSEVSAKTRNRLNENDISKDVGGLYLPPIPIPAPKKEMGCYCQGDFNLSGSTNLREVQGQRVTGNRWNKELFSVSAIWRTVTSSEGWQRKPALRKHKGKSKVRQNRASKADMRGSPCLVRHDNNTTHVKQRDSPSLTLQTDGWPTDSKCNKSYQIKKYLWSKHSVQMANEIIIWVSESHRKQSFLPSLNLPVNRVMIKMMATVTETLLFIRRYANLYLRFCT